MLAQGQECVLWKARKEKKSSGVLSRIARQASVLFSEALGFIASPVVREDLDRTWQVKDPFLIVFNIASRIFSKAKVGYSKRFVNTTPQKTLDLVKISQLKSRD